MWFFFRDTRFDLVVWGIWGMKVDFIITNYALSCRLPRDKMSLIGARPKRNQGSTNQQLGEDISISRSLNKYLHIHTMFASLHLTLDFNTI